MTKFNNPYTYPHLKQGRRAMVNYLTGIGGYSRFRDITCPISFNVAADAANFDFDHLWEKYKDDREFVPEFETPEDAALYYRVAKREHAESKDYLWDWGAEDAQRGVLDGDTYCMLWDGQTLDVTWEFHGRCGKHLCLVAYEGYDLTGMDETVLWEMLMTQTLSNGEETAEYVTLRRGAEWNLSYEFVVRMYKFMRQCEQDFTSEKASAEVEYQGAWQLFNNMINPAYETALAERADHEQVVEAARTLRESLQNFNLEAVLLEFKVLCKAAQIQEDEL